MVPGDKPKKLLTSWNVPVSYDFGLGAGFYVDATQPPWSRNYRMASYVERELPGLISSELPADVTRQSIMGHSMGDTVPSPSPFESHLRWHAQRLGIATAR
jgi:S-formylglutathione hydrolase FrmB